MDRKERIKARAHELWEAEGRPDGRHEAHWAQAEAELSQEDENVSDGADVAENPYMPTAPAAAPDNAQPTTAADDASGPASARRSAAPRQRQ